MGELILRPTPLIPMEFTGERLTSTYGGQTEIEHMHRYLLAREWCREKDVLDIASGEGYGTAMLASVARSAMGIEVAHDAVEHAMSAYARDRLSYVVGDARELPVPDASCDVVVSFETIEHFTGQDRFLDEVRRVLRPEGLLIVSTPDRDNYSPAETPANPYHVQELTSIEFETLLRSRFSDVSMLLQRPVFGSILMPTGAGGGPPLCFERRGASHFEASAGLARPQYLVAFASNGPGAALPPSVYIETGRLGMLTPANAEAKIRSVQTLLDGEQARANTELAAAAEAHRAELTAVVAAHHAEMAAVVEAQRREKALLDGEQARANAELAAAAEAHRAEMAVVVEAHHREQAAALGRAKGLLAANVMAERACEVLREEIRSVRRSEGGLAAELTKAREFARMGEAETAAELTKAREFARLGEAERAAELARAREISARLENTLASHSWRLTAPLRRLSLLLYPRT
jgi:hypothetical protein